MFAFDVVDGVEVAVVAVITRVGGKRSRCKRA